MNGSPGAPQARYHALDAMRGIAAIAVVFCHYTEHNGLHWLTGSWVAVDIFFILSGFVLMHSYGHKIEAGMRATEFLRLRVIRLGPLYLVGLALGLLAALLHIALHDDGRINPASLAKAVALGSLLIPYLHGESWPFGWDVVHKAIFPLNDPAWSLFFEMFVNVVFIIYIVRVRKANHTLLAVAGILVFALITVAFRQNNPGWGAQNFIFGFPRVVAEFFLGTAIYRLHTRFPVPPRALTLVLLGVVIGLFFTSITAIAMANAFLFAPLLIAVLSRVEVSASASRVCGFLGDISYPLYITHYPIGRLMLEAYDPGTVSPAPQVLLAAAVAFVCAMGFTRLDKTLRRWLMARSAPRLTPAGA